MAADDKSQPSVDFLVISLESRPERWAAFQAANPEFTMARRAAGVEGKNLSRDALIAQRQITADNVYNAGALGCALSHVACWRHAVDRNAITTIIEDDAILHPKLFEAITLAIRAGTWDILLWGWNFDWPLFGNLAPGLAPTIMRAPENQPMGDPASFKASHFNTNIMRLYSAAGLLCYSVSPQGAEKLLQKCLPFPATAAMFYGKPSTHWANTGVDVELARHYKDMESYCSIPPLAFSPNDWNNSSIRPNDSNAPEFQTS